MATGGPAANSRKEFERLKSARDAGSRKDQDCFGAIDVVQRCGDKVTSSGLHIPSGSERRPKARYWRIRRVYVSLARIITPRAVHVARSHVAGTIGSERIEESVILLSRRRVRESGWTSSGSFLWG
jgi:hypothetical protein